MKKYDEARAEIQASREHYGAQWKKHLDRYGLPAYFYELVGILGRLESLIVDPDNATPPEVPNEVVAEEIQDKLIDLGNYAGFMHDWIEIEKARLADEEFRMRLP